MPTLRFSIGTAVTSSSAEEDRPPAIGRLEAGDDAQGRGLAAAGRARATPPSRRARSSRSSGSSARVPSANVLAQPCSRDRNTALGAIVELAVATSLRRRNGAGRGSATVPASRAAAARSSGRTSAYRRCRSRAASRHRLSARPTGTVLLNGVCSIQVMLNSPTDSVTTISEPATIPARQLGSRWEEALPDSWRRACRALLQRLEVDRRSAPREPSAP